MKSALPKSAKILLALLAGEFVIGLFVWRSMDAGTYASMAVKLGLSYTPKLAPVYDGPNVGQYAPLFSLEDRTTKTQVTTSDLLGKPTVLLFGSYTCPFFQTSVPLIEKIHKEFKQKVRTVVVYTQESHAPAAPIPGKGNDQITVACSIADRRKVASFLAQQQKLSLQILLDTMDDRAAKAYASGSARLYVLDSCGKVAFRGAKPFVVVGDGVKVVRKLLDTQTVCRNRAAQNANAG